MRELPYDRALVLASFVDTMRDHYVVVDCDCGVHRVIGLGHASAHPQVRQMTMAHFALRLRCEGCENGPDRVVLTATVYCLWAPSPSQTGGGGGELWALRLVERDPPPSRRMKFVSTPDGGQELFLDAWRRSHCLPPRRAGTGPEDAS